MSIGSRVCPLFLAALFSLGSLSAQQPATVATPHSRTIQLDVVVAPKGGKPVAELQQRDFTVLDNKAPQPLTSFRVLGEGQEPVEVLIVIDAVNTSYQNIAYERGEISKFLLANGGHLAHPTSLAIFTDTGTQIQSGSSQDGKALNAALKTYTIGLRDIRRSQGIYGADDRLQLSLQALHLIAEREAGQPGRKLVLWLSPGWPILSGPGIQLDAHQQEQIFTSVVGISAQLRQARVTLYSVDSLGAAENVARVFYYQEFEKGVTKPSETQIGDLSLQVLAVQSGGLALNSSGVSELFQQCLQDTNAYYEMSVQAQPADKANEYHHIEVKVAQPGLTARTRDGYYAQP